MTISAERPDQLEIELGDGFADDKVAVFVDGQEVWRLTDVSTNWSVGIADVVRIALASSGAPTVSVRARDQEAAYRMPAVDRPARLRADLDPTSGLHLRPAAGEPAY